MRRNRPYEPIPKEFLTEEVTPEQAEAQLRDHFGEDWSRLSGRRREGDRLMRFSSGPQSWGAKVGRSGYALVRGEQVIDHFVTLRN